MGKAGQSQEAREVLEAKAQLVLGWLRPDLVYFDGL